MAWMVAAALAAEPFDRTTALAGYAAGWAGSYGAAGLGGRLRVEPLRYAGVDLFAEHYVVEAPQGFRHDHPIGFDLYVPVALGGGVRVRPLAGMCAVGSFVRSEVEDAPGADDVLFGVHGGAGVELALGERVSAFLDGKAVAWAGHDRAVRGWTGSVGSELSAFGVAQVGLGLQVHP